MLIYALDATHFTANFGAKRGAEIAPPSNNIVVDTLSLDAPHHHSLIERVTGAFTLSEPHVPAALEFMRDGFPHQHVVVQGGTANVFFGRAAEDVAAMKGLLRSID